MRPVTGWRVFSLGEGGALVPPFAQRYWPDRNWRAWPGVGQAVAVCLEDDTHMAPEVGCTCGLRATEDPRSAAAFVMADSGD